MPSVRKSSRDTAQLAALYRLLKPALRILSSPGMPMVSLIGSLQVGPRGELRTVDARVYPFCPQ